MTEQEIKFNRWFFRWVFWPIICFFAGAWFINKFGGIAENHSRPPEHCRSTKYAPSEMGITFVDGNDYFRVYICRP